MDKSRTPMISVQMYTLREYTRTREDLFSTLDRLAALGITGIQGRTPAFMSDEEFAYQLASRGLYADSVIASLSDILNNPAYASNLAGVFGIDVVRTDGMPPELMMSRDGFVSYAHRLEAAAERLGEYGIRLMYHNHHGEFTLFHDYAGEECISGMQLLLENTDKTLFQPDLHHMTYAGFAPEKHLSMFSGRAQYIHLQGYGIKPGFAAPFTMPVGLGTYDWQKIISTALEIGIYNFVLEQDFTLGNPIDDIALGYKNLKKYLEAAK
ncbi:MAG: sugar phosphate isomerase/epimerase [Clostridiales bacterium]|nr:sugar phosphate isomerase/epimerase [Clostridiales bacterium]